MSTLAVEPKQVRLYRLLWHRWIIVLHILLGLGANKHPVRWRAVADVLLVDKKTSQKYLAGLVRDGHLALAGDGYMFTQAGFDFLMTQTGGGNFSLLEEGKNIGEKVSPLVVEVVNDSELKPLTTPPTKWGKNPGEIFSPLAKQVFELIPELFNGAQLVTTGLPWTQDDFQDELLLGWVAYVYDKRTSLNSPVGLLYSKLARNERPPMEYMRSYIEILPEPFMERLGLVQFECSLCEQVFNRRDELDQHRRECHHPCLECGADFPSADAERAHYLERHAVERETLAILDAQPDTMAGQLWRAVLDGLRAEMPRASFDTWCAATVGVRLADGVLQVQVRNSYAREWLVNRCQTQVDELLAVQAPGVKVRFVVSVETEA